ncbi:MAG: formyltransferase family protein [Bdellovibrionaceae bacterium]|nr:formyltransferase family protein [Pseudobdellovibrionaceae bacterium]
MAEAWAIFISGRGSNLAALLDLPWLDVRVVVSSKADAQGILRARRVGIPVRVLERQIDWIQLDSDLRNLGVTKIFLAGFMRLLPPAFVDRWRGRVFNIHPSLLPLFPGKEALERSFVNGGPIGVTIHEAVAEVDAGPILLQRKLYDSSRGLTLDQVRILISRVEQNLIREAVCRLS